MSRYQKLDKNELLNAAERVIQKQGTHALSIGTVATEAGVSRGGIQSNFGSRAQLIEALFDRWEEDLQRFKKQVRAQSDGTLSELDVFMTATRLQHKKQPEQMSAMMVLAMQEDDRREASHIWVQDKLNLAAEAGGDKCRNRLRLLVHEAMMIMHSMQLTPLSEEEWDDVWEDLDGVFKDNSSS